MQSRGASLSRELLETQTKLGTQPHTTGSPSTFEFRGPKFPNPTAQTFSLSFLFWWREIFIMKILVCLAKIQLRSIWMPWTQKEGSWPFPLNPPSLASVCRWQNPGHDAPGLLHHLPHWAPEIRGAQQWWFHCKGSCSHNSRLPLFSSVSRTSPLVTGDSSATFAAGSSKLRHKKEHCCAWWSRSIREEKPCWWRGGFPSASSSPAAGVSTVPRSGPAAWAAHSCPPLLPPEPLAPTATSYKQQRNDILWACHWWGLLACDHSPILHGALNLENQAKAWNSYLGTHKVRFVKGFPLFYSLPTVCKIHPVLLTQNLSD